MYIYIDKPSRHVCSWLTCVDNTRLYRGKGPLLIYSIAPSACFDTFSVELIYVPSSYRQKTERNVDKTVVHVTDI